MVPASHLQSFDAVHVRLRDMSKSQSSNVDGRCDGDEMSVRDQRGRTSPSDRVKEDVSQEYFTCRNFLNIIFNTKERIQVSYDLTNS